MGRSKAERMAMNRLRNEVQVMANKGEFNDDPAFMRALNMASEGMELSDLGGDYYELHYAPRGGGKMKFVRKDIPGGQSQSATSLKDLLVASRFYSSGISKSKAKAPDAAKIARILEENITPGSIQAIGSLGARTAVEPEVALQRAAVLLGDADSGINRQTGMAFNGVGVDAGHLEAHVGNPLASNDPANIGFENKYTNRSKSGIEKIAGQLGRVPTGEEYGQALFKSFLGKVTADPNILQGRKGSAVRAAQMDPINAKVEKYLANLRGDNISA